MEDQQTNADNNISDSNDNLEISESRHYNDESARGVNKTVKIQIKSFTGLIPGIYTLLKIIRHISIVWVTLSISQKI